MLPQHIAGDCSCACFHRLENGEVQLFAVESIVTFNVQWMTPYVKIRLGDGLYLYWHLHNTFSEADGRATGILSICVLFSNCEMLVVDAIGFRTSRLKGARRSRPLSTLRGLETSRVGWCAPGVHAQQAFEYRHLVRYGGRIRRIVRVDC